MAGALLALALVAGASFPAAAQTVETLVKNTGQSVQGTVNLDSSVVPKLAQGFTTGSNATGYTLGSIGIELAQIASVDDAASELTVTLNAESSSGNPGDALCTLSDPASFAANALNTFDAPTTGTGACPTLTENTTYFLVVDRSGGTGRIDVDTTTSTSDDSGAAAGWSIADKRYFQSFGSWGSTDNQALLIEIKGSAKAAQTAPQNPTNLTATAGNQQVTLAWIAPVGDGGSDITKYQYCQKENTTATCVEADWTDIANSAPGEANANSFTIEMLDNGTAYTFRVRAVNAIGGGTASNAVTETPEPPPAATVTAVDVTIDQRGTGQTATRIRQAVRIEVTFSEAVTVTGTPVMKINVGGTEEDTLRWGQDPAKPHIVMFYWTTGEGDLDTDGVSITAGSITFPSGASIVSKANGTPVNPAYPALAANANVKVDGVRPSVSSATVDGTALVITWSEDLWTTATSTAGSRFTVKYSSGSPPVETSVAGTGNAVHDATDASKLAVTLASAVPAGVAPTLDYAKGPLENDGHIQDLVLNDANSSMGTAVTNNGGGHADAARWRRAGEQHRTDYRGRDCRPLGAHSARVYHRFECRRLHAEQRGYPGR